MLYAVVTSPISPSADVSDLASPQIVVYVMQDTDLTVIPSDLPSMMRWYQGDNVKASSLDASTVVEKLVATTGFKTVQGKRRGELLLRRGNRAVMQQL